MNNTKVVQHGFLLAPVNDDLMTSIISLKNDPRFTAFYEWLKASEKKVGDAYLWAKEPEMNTCQGRLQIVTVILKTIDESLDKMQEFKTNQNERIKR